MSVKERQTYKVNVEQIREGVVEVDAMSLQRAMHLAEIQVREESDEIEWDTEEISTPNGSVNYRGEQ